MTQHSSDALAVRVDHPGSQFHGMEGRVIKVVWVEFDGEPGPVRFGAEELRAVLGERS